MVSFLLVLFIALFGYGALLRRSARALRQSQGRGAIAEIAAARAANQISSQPVHQATRAFLHCLVPPLLLLLLWSLVGRPLIDAVVLASVAEGHLGMSPAQLALAIKSTPLTAPLDGSVDPLLQQAARLRATLLSWAPPLVTLVCAILSVLALVRIWRKFDIQDHSRVRVEHFTRWVLLASSALAILVTVGIVLSLVFEAASFFAQVSPIEFLTGLRWSPQIALRPDQQGSSGQFGAVPLFVGTIQISFLAMLVAAPVGLATAIFLSEYASARIRSFAKPVLEILAGIPTIVYGFFAALTLAPLIRSLGAALGLSASGESALAAGLVMGVMIIPFISSLTDDALRAVPSSLKDGALGLGSTRFEVMTKVVVPAAFPGIVSGLLLGVSRALGETMIVVMAAGISANLTLNPFAAVTTITVQIASLLFGDQEFDSPRTLSVFALGLVLFCATLTLNMIALWAVRRFSQKYE